MPTDQSVSPRNKKPVRSKALHRRPSPSPKSLANLIKWKPGQSGNPGGFTGELAEVQALARQASPEAMQNIIDKMSSTDERVSLLAADKVLERAWGKPKEQQGDTGPMAGMSKAERQVYIMKLLAYAASLKVPPEFEASLDPVVLDDEEPER